MKFKDLQGNIHGKDISYFKWGGTAASKGELALGDKLKKLFPNITIYAQMPCFGTRLLLDFYIHDLKLAFEFDGRQHEEFVPHFHKNRRNFQRHKDRDYEKEEWCRINQIRLVRLKTDDMDRLEEMIR